MGGRFCLSDDAHSVDQVAIMYDRILPYTKTVGIETLYAFERTDPVSANAIDEKTRFPHVKLIQFDASTLKVPHSQLDQRDPSRPT